MANVVYRSWSLIARDLKPEQQDPTLTQPPMLPAVAVDPGGSLHFDLSGAPSALSIQITLTGLSGEGRGEGFLRVYRGTEGAYIAVEATWSRGQDGHNAVFTTHISGEGERIKLHLGQGLAIFVVGISFGSD